MKKHLALALILISVSLLPACGAAAPPESAASAKSTAPALSSDGEVPAETIYIPVISKGFQHKFWQTVRIGANDAAAKYGVEITFEGPPSESDVGVQVDMLNAALSKNPRALCLAALDTGSVTEQLNACAEKQIPVIGFDSGVPNAPAGSIASTASTDNEAAGALAADEMNNIAEVSAAIAAATADAPIIISVISQDAASASITGRTTGFVNRMFEICEAAKPGEVAVTGHDNWAKFSSSGNVAVEILVSIAASTSVTDCQTAAQTVILRGPVGVFCTNSGSVDGMLAATSDGSDLDRVNGRYKSMVVVGFDSGATLLNAVRNRWFCGAVTQDPYMIGYHAVELACKTIQGEAVPETVDTGCQFYTHENMDEPGIAALLYE